VRADRRTSSKATAHIDGRHCSCIPPYWVATDSHEIVFLQAKRIDYIRLDRLVCDKLYDTEASLLGLFSITLVGGSK
jgi:hypothetical protein